ncbi:MAG: saccharopine dehydrogenase NADP-binding domain-containing protein [Chitinophagales bacterium]
MIQYPDFMIYGANGYTGRLVARMAAERGMKPLLAGRNEQELMEMSKQLKLPYQICSLEDTRALNDLVLSVKVVLHCAGPFEDTALPMIKACIKNKTHYLDITGEIAVFEMLAQMNERFKEADIMVLPGVGFDVVPSDCLAAYLKNCLPTATHLTLAFTSVGSSISHGTATTMLRSIDKGGAIRERGVIKEVPSIYKKRSFEFWRGGKPQEAVTIPWGDVSTAYYSTGIPNIEVYTAVTPATLWFMKNASSMKWLLKRDFVKRFLQKAVDARPSGPTDRQRKKASSFLWGEATDSQGNKVSARLSGPEGYTITALTALASVRQVLNGKYKVGFQTPSSAYGYDFIMEIPGMVREDVLLNRKIDIQ